MRIGRIFRSSQESNGSIQMLRGTGQVSMRHQHLPQIQLPDSVVWLDRNCFLKRCLGGGGFAEFVVSLTECVLGFCGTWALPDRGLQLSNGRRLITLFQQDTAK